MKPEPDHISVCICTYKRPQLLEHLLNELQKQETGNIFTYSIVVVDNDKARSAEPVVSSFRERALVPLDYHCEPEQNIALARNRAVENAKGNFIAFVDDDEFPESAWLLNLYSTLRRYNADGVLGPVKPHFEVTPPHWVLKAKLCDRENFETRTD